MKNLHRRSVCFKEDNTLDFLSFQQVDHRSVAVSERALQPPGGQTAKSPCNKRAARQKAENPPQKKCVTKAERSPTLNIYENVCFHKGVEGFREDAAKAHDADDMCAIYNNV